jgi:hypothetical protein
MVMGWWYALFSAVVQVYCQDDETASQGLAVDNRGWVHYCVNSEPEGWYLLVVQQPRETVTAAVARTARSRDLLPEQVMAAWVLGYADADRIRDWPHFFEWRRPGFEGSVQGLRGYRRAYLERTRGYFMGPN